MPIKAFPQANTFVAFLDIAGFKAMMNEGQRASLALNDFYNAGYLVLREHRTETILVDGFFISDCGILFVRGERATPTLRLQALLTIIREIHQRAFRKTVQLTTSIAWGEFSYQERIDFPGIEKNPIYGNAYIAAFKDNGAGSPKLYPNECRLLKEGLPQEVVDFCQNPNEQLGERIRETPKHFYYDWMRA